MRIGQLVSCIGVLGERRRREYQHDICKFGRSEGVLGHRMREQMWGRVRMLCSNQVLAKRRAWGNYHGDGLCGVPYLSRYFLGRPDVGDGMH